MHPSILQSLMGIVTTSPFTSTSMSIIQGSQLPTLVPKVPTINETVMPTLVPTVSSIQLPDSMKRLTSSYGFNELSSFYPGIDWSSLPTYSIKSVPGLPTQATSTDALSGSFITEAPHFTVSGPKGVVFDQPIVRYNPGKPLDEIIVNIKGHLNCTDQCGDALKSAHHSPFHPSEPTKLFEGLPWTIPLNITVPQPNPTSTPCSPVPPPPTTFCHPEHCHNGHCHEKHCHLKTEVSHLQRADPDWIWSPTSDDDLGCKKQHDDKHAFFPLTMITLPHATITFPGDHQSISNSHRVTLAPRAAAEAEAMRKKTRSKKRSKTRSKTSTTKSKQRADGITKTRTIVVTKSQFGSKILHNYPITHNIPVWSTFVPPSLYSTPSASTEQLSPRVSSVTDSAPSLSVLKVQLTLPTSTTTSSTSSSATSSSSPTVLIVTLAPRAPADAEAMRKKTRTKTRKHKSAVKSKQRGHSAKQDITMTETVMVTASRIPHSHRVPLRTPSWSPFASSPTLPTLQSPSWSRSSPMFTFSSSSSRSSATSPSSISTISASSSTTSSSRTVLIVTLAARAEAADAVGAQAKPKHPRKSTRTITQTRTKTRTWTSTIKPKKLTTIQRGHNTAAILDLLKPHTRPAAPTAMVTKTVRTVKTVTTTTRAPLSTVWDIHQQELPS